ncbi:MAG TPA: fumarylacetoacetate hydrolase family protein [Steroidobacteraceae bacterium]|jgi:2-keto-4-pentenoate hydratase|nr:fumarylacetoacetate hydrolase family protein [Steroidobacteraceae bacterium]
MSADVAAKLRQAERDRRPIPPVRDAVSDPSVEHAYRVQRENVQLRERSGERRVGRKIGLTSVAVQRQLGVDQPDFGVLFASMEIPADGALDLRELIQPRIEAEIAFVLARDIDQPAPDPRTVMAAVDYALPCLEIVDSRIADWKIGIFDTVADNASAGRFVAGTLPRRLTEFDFIHCGMLLRANGEIAATGVGAACLGNPIEALRWLAAKAFELEDPLRAGDIVLSGALGPMTTLRPGTHYAATIGGLGVVVVNVDGARE